MTPRPPLFPPTHRNNHDNNGGESAYRDDGGVTAYCHESLTFRTLWAHLGQEGVRGRAGYVAFDAGYVAFDADRVIVRAQIRRAILWGEDTP